MAPTLRTALAPTFTWTSASPDLVLTFPSGASPVNVTMPSGAYRMLLAPTSGSVKDFLRELQTSINTAMTGAPRGETFTVTMGADSTITLALSSGTFSAALSSVLRYCGFASAPSGVASATGGWPPRFFATFAARASADWTQVTPVAGSETAAGVGYGVTSGVTTWEDEFTFGFVPQNPVQRAALALHQTPWHSNDADLASVGSHNPPESLSDVLASSLGKTCALALGNLQDLRTSTTERYHLVTIPAQEIGRPRKVRTREGWDAYFEWTVKMIRQSSTPTATRA